LRAGGGRATTACCNTQLCPGGTVAAVDNANSGFMPIKLYFCMLRFELHAICTYHEDFLLFDFVPKFKNIKTFLSTPTVKWLQAVHLEYELWFANSCFTPLPNIFNLFLCP
jgi:hypothetical protein